MSDVERVCTPLNLKARDQTSIHIKQIATLINLTLDV